MIIKNSKLLGTDYKKKKALSILEAGLNAALPNLALRKFVKSSHLMVGKQKIMFKDYQKIHVVAVGKAADLMVYRLNKLTKIHGGIVVIPQNESSLLRSKKFMILRSGHPIPNNNSMMAAKKTINFLTKTQENDFVIFLISGGTSSLLSLPDGISMKEKQQVTTVLLKCGASIDEINCVRKHLSKVKGGQITKFLNCQAVALVLSDVIGDDLSSIGSGLTYCDNTTFQDAKKIIARYGLQNKMPKKVLARINLGIKKIINETPKKSTIKNYVISSNRDCLDAMLKSARTLGFRTKVIYPLSGNVKDAAIKLARSFPIEKKTCLVFGGETTVKVKGNGKGGRNQELVLHLLKTLSKEKAELIMASIGTDGIDGNTSAAGALAVSSMPTSIIKKYIFNNNSNAYFKKYGGLIFTGPTHTNLMDVGLILRD